jgi:hypothetical protein
MSKLNARAGSRRIKVVAVVVALAPTLASAQPTEPVAGAPAPPPVVAPPPEAPPPPPAPASGGPPDAWLMQARLPTTFGIDSLIDPGFAIGHRSGAVVLGAQLGLTGARLTNTSSSGSSSSDSLLLLQVMPMIYLDVWHSRDGRARMNLVGGLGFGRGSVTTENTDSMNLTTSTTTSVLFMPILAGFGGDYYLTPNFALGVELSAEIPIVLSVTNDGTDQKIGGALESVHGLIRFTLVLGD